jgi:hypothetical protein
LPEPLKLSVRWPGGKITTADLPANAREAELSITGELKARP